MNEDQDREEIIREIMQIIKLRNATLATFEELERLQKEIDSLSDFNKLASFALNKILHKTEHNHDDVESTTLVGSSADDADF